MLQCRFSLHLLNLQHPLQIPLYFHLPRSLSPLVQVTPILPDTNRCWGQFHRTRHGRVRDFRLDRVSRRDLFRSPQPRCERALRPDLFDTVLGGQITKDDRLQISVFLTRSMGKEEKTERKLASWIVFLPLREVAARPREQG